jgi:hypothetical protein
MRQILVSNLPSVETSAGSTAHSSWLRGWVLDEL